MFSALAVDALRRTGKRGVLLVGWAGLGNVTLTDDVLVVDEAFFFHVHRAPVRIYA